MLNYDTPVDYSGYTVDQLQSAFVQAGADLVTLSNVRQHLLDLMARRKAQAEAVVNIANLSATERDALRAALS